MPHDELIRSVVSPIAVPYQGSRTRTSTQLFLDGVLASMVQIRNALEAAGADQERALAWYLGLPDGSIPGGTYRWDDGGSIRVWPISLNEIETKLDKMHSKFAEAMGMFLEEGKSI